MNTHSTTATSGILGEVGLPMSLQGLRAESSFYPVLRAAHDSRGNSGYDDVVAAIYKGWIDDSVIMAGVIFSYLWSDVSSTGEFTSPVLRLLFSMESGGAEDDVFLERGSALKDLLREYLEWSEKFLKWGVTTKGKAPKFPWERLSKELVREGIVDPAVVQGKDFEASYQVQVMHLSILFTQPVAQMLWENGLLPQILLDYYKALGEMATALTAEPMGERTPQPLLELCKLSPGEKELLRPMLATLIDGVQNYGVQSINSVKELVLSNGGAFTVENLLSFAPLVEEYNWEWAVAAMEWKREAEFPTSW